MHQVMRKRVGAALSSDAITSYLPLVESLVRSHMADWQASGDFDLEAKVRAAVKPLALQRSDLHRCLPDRHLIV